MYDTIQALGVQEDLRSKENPLGLVKESRYNPLSELELNVQDAHQEKTQGSSIFGYLKRAAKETRDVLAFAGSMAVLFYGSFFPGHTEEYLIEKGKSADGHKDYGLVLVVENDRNPIEKLIRKKVKKKDIPVPPPGEVWLTDYDDFKEEIITDY